jgi:hypothetical protein
VRRLAPFIGHKRTHTPKLSYTSCQLELEPSKQSERKGPPSLDWRRVRARQPRPTEAPGACAGRRGETDGQRAFRLVRRAPSAIARRVGVARRTCLNTVHALYAWGCPARHVYAACWHVLLTYLPARTCLLTFHSTGVTSQWNTTLHPHDSHVSIGHLSPLRARCFALAWCHQRTECPPRRATQHHPSVV